MHAKRIRLLLHAMSNKLVAVDACIQQLRPEDIPEASRDSYRDLQTGVESIKGILHEAREAVLEVLHKHYPEYPGEPPLVDKNNQALKMGDLVGVPSPETADMWSNEFVGTIISTTRGDGLICVRDQDDDCWDIEASKVTRQ